MHSSKALNVWGHIGYIFIIIGMLFLAQQNLYGWVFRLVGEVIWVVIGVHLRMSSVWSWGSIFVCLDLYGAYSWYHR